MPDNTKDVCRKCGADIVWKFQEGSSNRGNWHGTGTWEGRDCTMHDPRGRCWFQAVNDYIYCGRPVKHEEIVAELFCCGRHRKRAEDEKRENDRRLKAIQEQQARQAIEDFKIAKYEECRQWFVDNGHEHLVANYRVNSGYRGVKTAIEIDLFDLRDLLIGKKEEEECTESEIESSSLRDSWLSMLEEDSST